MDRALLEKFLADGMSLERIGQLVNRHPTTVSYWLKKHGLSAVHSDRCSPKGGIDREILAALVDADLTLAKMASELGLSISTVQHWLVKHGLEPRRSRQRRESRRAREELPPLTVMTCPQHGATQFRLATTGYHRCLRCRSEAVTRRRRKVKAVLIAEAGGRCKICGYDRHPGALQFHHCDPSVKEFGLSHGGVSRSLEKAIVEMRKCVLLCSNCHAEVEAGLVVVP